MSFGSTNDVQMHECKACGEKTISLNAVKVTDENDNQAVLCGSCFVGATEIPE